VLDVLTALRTDIYKTTGSINNNKLHLRQFLHTDSYIQQYTFGL